MAEYRQLSTGEEGEIRPGDINVASLRTTLDDLEAQGRLVRTETPVDPDLEIAGIQKKLDGGPTMLFENVEGWDHARFAVNMFANRLRIDDLFGFESRRNRTERIAEAVSNPIPPVEVSPDEAPT